MRRIARRSLLVVLAALTFGFLSVPPAAADDPGWPREIQIPEATIVLFQPQVESFDGNSLDARAAVSVTATGETEPHFGAVWLATRVETDRDERLVYLQEVRVPRVRFPNSTPQQEAELSGILEREIMTWDLVVSLDRLLAGLADADVARSTAADLATAPPTIIYRSSPAVLVVLDGAPQMQQIDGSQLMRVVNTPFLIVLDSSTRAYYLYAGTDAWYTATEVTGEWSYTARVPAEVAALAPEEGEAPELPEGDEAANAGEIPGIVVATEPTELVYTEGEPTYTPIGTLPILYVSNTDSDILMDIDTQTTYVLLSGRWYGGPSLEGPWTFVAAEDLPASFREIPDDSEVGDIRAHVAGTAEASEAVMDAQIPQTAAVDRGPADIEVEYDGDPQFAEIPGTGMKYALNTPQQVLEAEGRFWACLDGVWYVGSRATGPWEVATQRPAEVDAIPPDNPNYNVKYVYVYDSTPDVVYVGYTPGYTSTYVYGGTIVYGTGYYYPGWYGNYYYPRHSTWGFHVRWNPWSGWSFGVTYSNGRFTFGIGFGGWGRWHGGWWGVGGYHGYWRGYRRGFYHGWHRGYYHGARAGYRAGYRAGARAGYRRDNIYRAQDRAHVRSGDRATTRPATANRANNVSRKAANNVFADRNGDVYRRNSGGSWDRREGGDWSSAGRPEQRPRTGAERPTTAQQPTQRPSASGGSLNRLERQNSARSRGAQRTNSFQGSRGGSRGGAARRGGGRRR